MHITQYSDYALRILMYLSTHPEKNLVTKREISDIYGISYNHINKIIYDLGKMNIVHTIKGRNGGVQLAKNPKDINLGELIRVTENCYNMVECFDPEHNTCILSSACRMKHIFLDALDSYFKVLDSYTVQDLIVDSKVLKNLMQPTRA